MRPTLGRRGAAGIFPQLVFALLMAGLVPVRSPGQCYDCQARNVVTIGCYGYSYCTTWNEDPCGSEFVAVSCSCTGEYRCSVGSTTNSCGVKCQAWDVNGQLICQYQDDCPV